MAVSAFWILPTLLWSGEPIDQAQDKFGQPKFGLRREDFGQAKIFSPIVDERGDFNHVMRRILCPDCVVNIMLINTLVVSIISVSKVNIS